MGDLMLDAYLDENAVNAGNSVIKNGAGVLTLGKRNLVSAAAVNNPGAFVLNDGTVILNAGDNTIAVNPLQTAMVAGSTAALAVNGGTLNLNGNTQVVGALTSVNSTQGGTAGTITNSGSAANFITVGASTQFDGYISGALSYYKTTATVGNVQTLVQANTYNGSTNVLGGTLNFKDYGTALNSMVVNVNGASLQLDNTGLSAISQRLNSGAVINLNGGTLTVVGQAGLNDTTNLGVTNLLQGANVITATATQLNSAAGSETLTIANLVRSAGATVNFTGTNLGTSPTAANGGLASASNINLTQINGAAPVLTNGILGGAYTVAGADFATLNSAYSVSTTSGSNVVTVLGGTTAGLVSGQALTGPLAGFTVGSIINATTFTVNGGNAATTTTGTTIATFAGISSAGVTALPATSYTTLTALNQAGVDGATNATVAAATVTGTGSAFALNSLRLTATTAITLPASSTLTLTSGGLLSNAAATATSITGAATTALTSGTSELNVYNNGTGVLTLAVPLTGAGVSLVKSGTGAVTLNAPASNSFGGTTYVNQGTLNLGGAASIVQIPGNLVVSSGGTVAYSTNVTGQIAATSNVTVNGSGILTLAGLTTASINQNIASLTLNNNGGVTGTSVVTPGVATGTLTITSANAIVANGYNAATAATISGTGSLVFGSGAVTTIQVNSNDAAGVFINDVAPDLTISAVISAASGGGFQFNKTGNGTLALSAANLNTGGWKITDGTLILANTTALGTTAGAFTIGDASVAPSGPITIMSGSTAISVGANPITVNRDFTFGGTASTNSLTLGGTVNLATGTRTITVTNPTVVATLGGIISNGSLIKAGDGILEINAAAASSLAAVTVNAGLLRLGASGALTSSTSLTVAAGGAFNMNAKATTVASLSGNSPTQGGLITNSGAAATLTVGTASGTTTFAGDIVQGNTSQSLALTKVLASHQVLAGANTYSGATTISGGGLIVTGSLANTAVTVASGAYLGGTGTIGVADNAMTIASGGSVTISSGGIIDLRESTYGGADAIGTLTIQGNSGATALNINANSEFKVNFSTNATDSITIGNNAKVNLAASGTLTISLHGVTSGTTLENGVYNLINFASGNGQGALGAITLAPVASGGSVNGTTIIYTASQGTLGSAANSNITATAFQLIIGNAGSYYWNGDQDTAWNTNNAGNTNWSDASGASDLGNIPGSSDTVFFGSNTGANMTTTLGASFSINGLIFGSGNNNSAGASPTGADIDVGNNSLTLNAVGINQQAGSLANTISSSGSGGVILLSTQAWTNNSSNNLTVSAPVSGSSGLVINGNGTGRVILSGNNTYANAATGTIVQAASTGATATLQLGSSTALGAVTNTLTVNGGSGTVGRGLVDLAGNNVVVGGLVGTAGTTSANTSSITSATAAILTVDQATNTTYSGSLDGSLALVKTGAGTLVLAEAAGFAGSTYSGGTTINGGILQIGSGAASQQHALALGTGLVTINTGGTLSFNAGAATPFTTANSVVLNGGTITSAATATSGAQHLATGLGATINIGAAGGTINAVGTLVNAAANTNDLYLHGQLTGSGSLTIGSGASRVHVENNTNTYSGILTNTGLLDVDASLALASASLVNNSANLRFGSSTTNSEVVTNVTAATFGSLAGNGNFALTNTATTAAGVILTVGGNNSTTTYTGIISGTTATNGLVKTGTGTMNLNATNTFNGGVTVSQGFIATNNVAGFGTGILRLNDASTGANNTGAFVTAAVSPTNAIVVQANGTGTTTLGTNGAAGGFSATSYDILKDVSLTAVGGTLTLAGGALTRSTAGTSILTSASSASPVTISAAITGSNTNIMGLTVNNALGSIVTTVSGANTYFGATNVTSGNLTAGSATGFSANSAYTMTDSAAAILTTGAFSTTVGSLSGGGSAGGNVVLTAAGTLSAGSLGTSTSYDGLLTGAGNFTKTGAGTMTLTRNNTYTGVTTLTGGVLSVNSLTNGGGNSGIGASSNAATNLVFNGGTLRYTGAASSTDRRFTLTNLGGGIESAGSGALNFTNTGAVTLTGTGTRTLTLGGYQHRSQYLGCSFGQ